MCGPMNGVDNDALLYKNVVQMLPSAQWVESIKSDEKFWSHLEEIKMKNSIKLKP